MPTFAFLLVCAVIVLLVWVALGYVLSSVLGDDFVGRFDRSTSRWFVRNRTADLNDATHFMSYLSETPTVVAAGAAAFVVARLTWKRWRESWFVLAALAGEVSIFLGVTLLVERNRPSVPRLDQAPPTSSFPSGHAAAAVVLYGALAILVSERFRSGAVVWLMRIVAVAAPLAVGAARLYRGMHFVTDVVAGLCLGIVWLLISMRGTRLGVARDELRTDPARPA